MAITSSLQQETSRRAGNNMDIRDPNHINKVSRQTRRYVMGKSTPIHFVILLFNSISIQFPLSNS
jgi:hypothetical protein